MDPYIGEIRLFAGFTPPEGWVFCQGQTLSIQANSALYSLLGTLYGGDGQTNFKLPDLQGLIVCGTGQASGSPNKYVVGQSFGSATATVSGAQMPAHTHTIIASTQPATATAPTGNVFAAPASPVVEYVAAGTAGSNVRDLDPDMLVAAGANQPHANLMPTFAVNYMICLQGLYPVSN